MSECEAAARLMMSCRWDVVYRGEATAKLQTQVASMRPDCQTLGNHEFDFGPARAAEYMRNVRATPAASTMVFGVLPDSSRCRLG